MLEDTDRAHFEARGYLRVPGAFTADEAAAMRDVVWRALASQGTDGDARPRIARFVDAVEVVNGVEVQVVELTATAGDVILIHPLVLHTAARRTRARSRGSC